MYFSDLIKKSVKEPQLLDLIAGEIQSYFYEYQNLCFFLKLNKNIKISSEIVWIKTFNSVYDLRDFYFDSVMERACISIKFKKDHYEILCHGFHHSNHFEVWPDRISEGCPIECSEDRENRKMISWELINGAFGELTDKLVS